MNIVIIDTETTGVTKDSNILEIGLVYYNTIEHNSIEKIQKAPKLSILIHRRELSHCQLGALELNSELIKEIAQYAREVAPGAEEYRVVNPTVLESDVSRKVVITDPEYVMGVIYEWILDHNVAELTNYAKNKFESYEVFVQNFKSGSISVDELKYYLQPITLAGKNIATFDIPILQNDIPKFSDFKYRYRMIDPTILYTAATDQMLPRLQECLNRLQIDKIIPTTTKHRAVDDCLDIAYLLYFHFKQSKYRTYVAVETNENDKLEIVDKITLHVDDLNFNEKLDKFKKSNKGRLVSYDLSFHRIGSLSRLDSFHTELKEVAIPKEIQIINEFEGGEIVINKDTIISDFKSGDYKIYRILKEIVDNYDVLNKSFISKIKVDYLDDMIILKPDSKHYNIRIIGSEVDVKKIFENVEKAYKTLEEKIKNKDEKTE